MKQTAMQELIKYFNERPEYDKTSEGYEIIEKAKQLLEKEKEQMLDFGLYVKKNGWVGCKIEDLYEDYNNQNK